MALSPRNSGSFSFPDDHIGRLARRLCIVARNHPLLFGYLTTLLRDRPPGSEQIEILIDRRHGAPPKEPTGQERRQPSHVEDELRERGFAFVAEPGEALRPRDASRIERTVGLLAGMEERSWPLRRRRPRPLLARLWRGRLWRAAAIVGAIGVIAVLVAAELRLGDVAPRDAGIEEGRRPQVAEPGREAPRAPAVEQVAGSVEPPPAARAPAPSGPVPSAPAPVTAVTPPGPALAPLSALSASTAPPPTAESPQAPPVPTAPILREAPSPRASKPVENAPPPARPAAARVAETVTPSADVPAVDAPAPSTAAPPAEAPPRAPAPAKVENPPRVAAAPPAEAPPRPAPAPSPAVDTPARSAAPPPAVPSARPAPVARVARATTATAGATNATTLPPAPTPEELRIELTARPTSATGGGVVYLVRVTDLDGQPLPDAEVWIRAGRRPGGSASFQTQLHPAETPGAFRSGVIHPGTLPADLSVRATVGNRQVEAPVGR